MPVILATQEVGVPETPMKAGRGGPCLSSQLHWKRK
jgi:hypothetical protein